jgi:hypothetical protein
MNKILSWPDRFALIDHYSPPDSVICATFNLSQAELETARQLRGQGMFSANARLDVTKYADMFSAGAAPIAKPTPVVPTPSVAATVHTRPESATRQPKIPQKRGRKGNKITTALQSVPTNPIPVNQFITQHGVSLAVLRQAKRFVEKMDQADAVQVGTVHVRQDKATKQLMIWREVGDLK